MKKAYSKLRNNLSDRNKGKLSKLAFTLSNSPSIKKDNIDLKKKFPAGQKGGLVISADFELAWAWRYAKRFSNPLQIAAEKSAQCRKNFPTLLSLFDKYNISITWATVGHLFLKQCEKEDHAWMSRIPYFENKNWQFKEGDWYDHDPHSNYNEDPEWYAPDLIQMIQNTKVEHEIGTHTFTHIDFTYTNCPPEVADDEIKACIEAAKPYNIQLKSIVFPGGTWGNIESLKLHGINIYRKNVKYDLAYPWRDELGVLVTNSSGSLDFNRNYGWSSKYFISRLKKYIDKAISTGTIAHLWFHPSLEPFFLEKVFPSFLEYASKKRNMGELWIGTMQEIANYINKNKIL